jgi:putative transposase
VILGARPEGTTGLIAIEGGFRESADSLGSVLRDLRRRGMRAPELAIGGGALGFWAALRDVWPETREQRDWVHRIANVLDKLPKRLQPKAKAALQEIMNAASRESAEKGIEAFCEEYGAEYPNAVATLTRDQGKLLTFFDFPAEHWVHIRTRNPIESAFATVRLRQRVTKGAGSRQCGLTMAFKLLEMAQLRWHRLNGAALLPLVRAGVLLKDGVQVESVDQTEVEQVAEDAA